MTIKSAAVVLLGVLGLGLGLSQSAAARPLDQVVSSGHLRIAVYRDYPPFSSGDGNQLKGLDVELGRIIARRLKVKFDTPLVIKAGDSISDDLRNAVWKGHYLGYGVADVMLHVPVDRQIALTNDNAYIFAPYFLEQMVVAVDPAQTGGTDLVSAFAEHKVGVEGDTLADNYLMGAFGGRLRENVVHFHSLGAAVAAMERGEVAGVMGPRSEIEATMKTKRGRYRIGSMPTPGLMVRSWPIGLAVKVNSHDLANAIEPMIDTMVKDGSFARLFAKYGLTYHSPKED
jgi:ABC-type amino acid transport substrate-binding protein